MFLEVNRKNKV